MGSKFHLRLSAAWGANRESQETTSHKIVQWRATVDEDGQYCFAVAL
jgi:hypothetical protein